MDKFRKQLVAVLCAISVIGILGIPLGDPRFVSQALVLESCFIALAALSAKNYKKVYIPNFIIAGVVIAGNSAFYKHIEIMTTFQSSLQRNCSHYGRICFADNAIDYKLSCLQTTRKTIHNSQDGLNKLHLI
jgi:hypothetical protein